MKNMKDTICNFFRRDLKKYIISLKDLVKRLFTEKKVQTLVSLGVILIIIAIIIITCNVAKSKNENINRDLENMGFATKVGNYIYYLGYDNGTVGGVYKVKTNGKDIEKVNTDYALYLNSDGENLYYLDYENKNIVKIDSKGKNKEVIVKDVDFTTVSLYDNYIYYIKDSNFYRIKTNGKSSEKLISKSIYTYEIYDGWIYYTYYNNEKYSLEKIKINGEKKQVLDEDVGTNFFIKGNYIYYIYENYASETSICDYELYKMKNNGKGKELITKIENMETKTMNVDGEKIYYTRSDSDSGLYSIYSIEYNGKNETKLVDIKGFSTSINIIDGYIYYPDNNEKENTTLFRIKTSGGEKQEII